MKNPAMFFKDFGDGASVAVWDGENIGIVVPWHAPGAHRFAWSFCKEPTIVSFRRANDSGSARAALTRHFLEWLYVTTTKEARDSVGSAA